MTKEIISSYSQERYLLDTHVVLWLAGDSNKLSEKAKAIVTSNSLRYISIASAWEVAIKLNTGKLQLEGGLETFYQIVASHNIQIIGARKAHLHIIENLELIHGDPFDRLIVATAQSQELVLVTIDKNIHKYRVKWSW